MKQTLTKTVASALSFAHLSSVRKGARAEGEDDKPKEDDDDTKAEGDDEKPKDDDKGAKGRADDGNGDKSNDDDDKPKEDDDDKSAKGKAEDDEDSDEEMRGNSAAAAARRRERARCSAIFASAAAGQNPVLAANLAFKTNMTRTEAIAVLEGSPAASAPAVVPTATRASRGNPNLGVPPTKTASKAQQAASSWDAALKAANPARRG